MEWDLRFDLYFLSKLKELFLKYILSSCSPLIITAFLIISLFRNKNPPSLLNSYIDLENTISYKYNQDGVRTKKVLNDVKTDYYLDGDSIIFEKTGENVLYYLYNDTSDLLGLNYNGVIYYYIKNYQNDIIGILDSNYNIVAKYKYDSWGNILSITNGIDNDISNDLTHIANINPFRYRSYYYDKEINLYYLNSRYYNPIWGRFISSDNYISTSNGMLGYNMFIYCNNNPVKHTDYSGHGFLLGIVAVGLIGTGLFLANSIRKLKKSRKEISKVQEKKNFSDKTKKLNQTMQKNAQIMQKAVEGQNIVQKLNTFKEYVTDDSIFDLKKTEEWNEPITYDGVVMEPQDIGNFHYGYIGRSIGIPEIILYGGAGINQLSKYGKETAEYCFTISFCDDPRDTIFIRMGAMKYDSEH